LRPLLALWEKFQVAHRALSDRGIFLFSNAFNKKPLRSFALRPLLALSGRFQVAQSVEWNREKFLFESFQ